MKLIGKNRDGYIVDMSFHELHNLCMIQCGKQLWYDLRDGKGVGISLGIDDAWKKLVLLVTERDALDRVCAQLRAMAELLEPVAGIVKTIEEKAGEEGSIP